MRKEQHMWTKEEIKLVNSLWATTTTHELCKKLGVDNQQLNYMVAEMRKAGLVLAKKHKKGNLQALIKEVMSEL